MFVKVVRVLLTGVLVLSLGALSAGAARAQGASPAVDSLTGTTYVGATSNPDLFVAVVLGDDGEARAYLCDNTGVSEWFTGTTDGATLDLASAPGGGLAAAIEASGVSGSATLADGTAVTFDAVPAQGVAGLYTSSISEDRRVLGSSSSGATLDGVIADAPLTGGDTSVFPLLGFLTPPDGVPVGFVVTLTGPDVPDQTRSIVLNDGQQRGRSIKPGRVWVTDPMRLSIQDGSSNT
jgi:hypothetical protein